MALGKLLTEIEVANILSCSPATVKRLRLTGRLTYIPGRPVRIDVDDLNAYLAALVAPQEAVESAAASPRTPERDFRRLARQVWLQRQSFRRSRDEKK
ncbi:helix-turn-helix domain-containing protein [Aminobacter sp. NyZ550]|uniref:helix-turn-helix domain-containing protein n=1 Tax=Aminobacter sp. NyZ550 TaxID=2979870 RepID=UPI0021D5F496|nr:helix-turn-helix domain-containing protein [Aminobacter sp. NyZ550]WAX97870.1 helix-turn-helix domain-containing protein [Aminobacter sp. NyZ550]